MDVSTPHDAKTGRVRWGWGPHTDALPVRCQVLKSVAGQSAFQLAVMYALVFHGDALFGVPSAASVQGPSVHYTLVFNAFVMMQLFNQARPAAPGRAGIYTAACVL